MRLRKLTEGLAQARDDAEAELREALGKLVALDISPRVECEGVERLEIVDGFAVRLVADVEGWKAYPVGSQVWGVLVRRLQG